MIDPYNTPIETGIRVLVLLSRYAPSGIDLDRLLLLDHGLLHSADFGGPESLHPSVPLRSAELGVKRRNIEQGLQVMLRAKLVEITPNAGGILYRASDGAANFLALLESNYVSSLGVAAEWVTTTFGDLRDEAEFRDRMAQVRRNWPAELSDQTAFGQSPAGWFL
jgi:hypothetical protein